MNEDIENSDYLNFKDCRPNASKSIISKQSNFGNKSVMSRANPKENTLAIEKS